MNLDDDIRSIGDGYQSFVMLTDRSFYPDIIS